MIRNLRPEDFRPQLAQSEGSSFYDTEPYADLQEQPASVLELDYRPMTMFDGNYPWNLAADFSHRQSSYIDPMRTYPLARQNRELLIELGDEVGREGTDWQNPYAWAAGGVLGYPNANSSELVPAYGQNASSNGQDLALNVRATAGVLQTGGFGS